VFKKVLIANRGEIALRINRACHELGLKTVAVYSQADADALHVKFADEAVCIGPPSARESYLNMQAILAAAEVTGADAIHPGYGFLSENPDFAEACRASKIKFIGPDAKVIDSMGNKVQAKQHAEAAGVPVLKSIKIKSEKDLDFHSIEEQAKAIGFPVLIKAAMGGGGRGMKKVNSASELKSAIQLARSESQSAFGSDEVYIEKYCVNPKHIEIQVLGDEHGHVVHLGERDCSIQRRHQKLIEEARSAVVSDKLRAEMGECAVALAKRVDYSSAGTIEFIVDENLNYFFLEMNTRIQVEHPVTEMITGIDLLAAQIMSAAGEKLRWSQDDIQFRGHAIECRITAEDPVSFAPCPGQISLFHPPMGFGVRLESSACSDYLVSPYYDSMISKLIVHAETRPIAIRKMKEALREFVVRGIKTTIPFHQQVMDHEAFISGRYTTAFCEKFFS